uniref:Uncharacterized protein n=1 Tax=Fervidicoccus fontis TaxID=683846 RepID=A0A7J3ZIK6_9CREN
MLDYATLKIALGGKELYKSIEEARSKIVVVTPWLSEDLAELLLKKHMEGVDVRVLTSSDCSVEEHRRALEKLISIRKQVVSRGSRVLRALGLTMLFAGVLLTLAPILVGSLPAFANDLLGLLHIGLKAPIASSLVPDILIPASLALLGTLVYGAGLARVGLHSSSRLGDERLRVYSPLPLVNLRVFIIDETAFVGSPSLGIKKLGGKTIESIMIVRNSEFRKKLAEALESLESSFSLKRVPNEILGLELKKPCGHQRLTA